MVNGFTKFKERFKGFENQYVIIGGTACDLIMETEELPFRATKDIDIVLIVASITAEFGRQFWEYVKEAKAWLDLKERKSNGEQVDSKNIKKHKNDVFRLAQLITVNTRQILSPEISEDMKKFLVEIINEEVDLKALGIRGTDKKKLIDMLYQCYGLIDNI